MPEVEKEIALCESCEARMDVSEVAPFSRVVCPSCKSENRVKRRFGPYLLTKRHAIGGMSSVFLAHDETLDREVALKILSEEFSQDEKRILAFEEEARLTASFSHPHVVRVLTTGRVFGRFYIAMEFVPGGHFEYRMRERGMVSEEEMLPLAIQIAEGLKAAQAAGLIHRDIKPGNILLDSEGNVKIVDFGLALVTKGGQATASEIWATPYYVPPEAIEFGVEDFRSDMYAFGATLYHALAGKPPCNEESMATDVLREAKKKVVSLRKMVPLLHDETCAVIDRAMAYDPNNRFRSYDEMISALKSALKKVQGLGTVDEREKLLVSKRMAQRKEARQRLVKLGMVALLLVLGAVVFAVYGNKEATEMAEERKVVVIEDREPGDVMDSPEQIATRYMSGRQALQSGDFSKAEKVFAELHRDSDVQEPTRTWAGLEAVAAALLDGRGDSAKRFAKDVSSHIAKLEGGGHAFKAGLGPVLEKLGEWEWFELDAMDPGAAGNERFMGYWLAGLKNWEQGNFAKAVPFFSEIQEQEDLASDGVMGWHRQVAGYYLDDYRALGMSPMNSEPQSAEQCREMVEELNRTMSVLKTKGRARFNIRARQIDLARIERAFGQGPVAGSAEDFMDELQSLADAYDFAKAIAMLMEMNDDPPGGKRESLLGISEAALVFLADLESDLEREARNVSLKVRDDTVVSKLEIGEGKRLVATLESGERRGVVWSDFPYGELIELHRQMVRGQVGELEQMRRHESAIAFQWLVGEREKASEAAVRLGSESEAFKSRWDGISAGLPK